MEWAVRELAQMPGSSMSVQQKTAAFKLHPSEIHPTNVGEIASPSK